MWASAWVVLAQWPAPSGAGAFRVSVSAAPLTSSAKRPLNEACAMCALALRSSFVFRTFRVCGEPSGAHVTACAHSCGLMSHSARSLFAGQLPLPSHCCCAICTCSLLLVLDGRAREGRASTPPGSQPLLEHALHADIALTASIAPSHGRTPHLVWCFAPRNGRSVRR